MESSFVLVACVWCEVTFLRSLAGQLQSRREVFQLRKLSLAQESARGFDSPAPHHFLFGHRCRTLRSRGRCAIKPRSAPELRLYTLSRSR